MNLIAHRQKACLTIQTAIPAALLKTMSLLACAALLAIVFQSLERLVSAREFSWLLPWGQGGFCGQP